MDEDELLDEMINDAFFISQKDELSEIERARRSFEGRDGFERMTFIVRRRYHDEIRRYAKRHKLQIKEVMNTALKEFLINRSLIRE